MDFLPCITFLRKELGNPLPGIAAQLKMSSMSRASELLTRMDIPDSQSGSVLLLLYPFSSETYLVLMQRPLYNGVHSGQISLPGGRFESFDHDLKETALRETKEEIGVDPETVTILGKLTDLFIPPSNFLVTPFIGFASDRPHFKRDPKEVQNIIELPVSALCYPQAVQTKQHQLPNGHTIQAPAYVVNNSIIWGATAMILSEFKEIINRFPG